MTWWTIGIGAWVLVNIALCFVGRTQRRASLALFTSLRPRMFLANLPVIAAVLVAGAVLLQVPGLDWGWWSLVSGRNGNAALDFATADVWLFAPFLALFAAAMPSFVIGEEEMFREGTAGTASMVKRSTVFGLVHCLVGVPIAAGLALILAGLWFTRQYRLGGIARAAQYHLAWNYVVLAMLAAAVFASGGSR